MVTFLAVVGLWNRQNAQTRSDAAEEPGGLFQAVTAEGTALAAVGPVTGLDQACTAWLLDVGAPAQTGAYAATTGTCAGAEDPMSVISRQPTADAAVDFHAFAPATSAGSPEVVRVPVQRIEWASIRGTDLAVLRLAATYGQLADAGIAAIRPTAPPPEGVEVLIAGVPVAGIPDDQQYLRGSRCQAGASTDVLAGPLPWPDAMASECAGILDGSQGSVMFTESGQAVGMVAASTIGAPPGADCTAERPCEVRPGGATVIPDRSYAVPVGFLTECFDEGRFARNGSCPLEDPGTVVVATADPVAAQPGADVHVQVSAEDAAQSRYKYGRVAVTDCLATHGWRPMRTPTRALRMPEQEGLVQVCVGTASQPSGLVIDVDGTPPDASDIELRRQDVPGGVRVQPVPRPPELSTFRWVSGPQSGVNCATAEGYVRYTGGSALIQAADQPSTVCVIGIDAAGNASEPSTHEIP